MAVKDILDEQIVDLDMNVRTKDEAIQHLSNKLLNAGYIGNQEDFVTDIYLRENEGITGIGNYIAIPHGKSETVQKVGIAIGKSKQDVSWETLDDNPVRLVFLFAVPYTNDYANNHLRLLAEIAAKLGNDQAIEKLQGVQTYQELLTIFS